MIGINDNSAWMALSCFIVRVLNRRESWLIISMCAFPLWPVIMCAVKKSRITEYTLHNLIKLNNKTGLPELMLRFCRKTIEPLKLECRTFTYKWTSITFKPLPNKFIQCLVGISPHRQALTFGVVVSVATFPRWCIKKDAF